ncbi:aspartate carbamoyltransferase catalytic subunit [Campylobacter sputorum]|uniref:aspartate carbamoyltransferase catalytic subunit n=1 Tax=Campylobacter sputorum TaxID=206 RepID=UPI00053BFF1E|nr:aspartate carbamoyltransferase catalytic subunit [Campylobacter sputorum]
MTYTQKDLISTQNLTKEDIFSFLSLADKFKNLNKKPNKKDNLLVGKTVINVFFENSTRTRTSFEIAAKRLGADAINFTSSNSSTKKGETLIDTIKNLEAMRSDIFVVRHDCSGVAQFIAQNTDVCVVNAGDGLNEHPSQALLDLYTIREQRGNLDNLTVAIIGDVFHSRVARSNIWAMKTLGINLKIFAPPIMMPIGMETLGCQICKNMEEAIDGSDVLIMLRIQLERQDGSAKFPSIREYSKYFGLTKKKMEIAKDGLMILHPGPINRGVEVDSNVADDKRFSHILNQVENGVAIRMAILSTLDQNRYKGKQ